MSARGDAWMTKRLEEAWGLLEQVASFSRASGSDGEARAAELIAAALEARGARTRIEAESVHGTYWIPVGLTCTAATIAGMAGPLAGSLLAALACACIIDDLEIGAVLCGGSCVGELR